MSEKGRATSEQTSQWRKALQVADDISELAQCTLVIEAIVEDRHAKHVLFEQLESVVAVDAVLASNTSSLSITELACGLRQPGRFCCFHFFIPVPLMKLVEVVPRLRTHSAVCDSLADFARKMGHTPVRAQDTPGFIVNLLLIPYLLQAIAELEKGVATKEDFDTAIRLGLNHPMGPFTLLDFVGLDTTLFIADAVFDETKDSRFAAPPLLRRMVSAGWLGRKSGRGFYDYGKA